MEPILDLITSYENRIATVEELMTTAYQATVTSDGSFDILDEERERLKTGLQKTLTKNCSLRRKDFDRLMEKILSDSNKNRVTIKNFFIFDRHRLIAGYTSISPNLCSSCKEFEI